MYIFWCLLSMFVIVTGCGRQGNSNLGIHGVLYSLFISNIDANDSSIYRMYAIFYLRRTNEPARQRVMHVKIVEK